MVLTYDLGAVTPAFESISTHKRFTDLPNNLEIRLSMVDTRPL